MIPSTDTWMQTYTGRQIDPADPTDFDIRDIAHALSNLCRYGGHCLRFYSVAEHSVLMARAADDPWKKWALLHDATEAYLVDIPRPIKRRLVGYQWMEHRLFVRMVHHFGLTSIINPILPSYVQDLDHRILVDEKAQNMRPGLDWPSLEGVDPLGVTLQCWTPKEAERHFLDMFAELTK